MTALQNMLKSILFNGIQKNIMCVIEVMAYMNNI